jgi:hypothetical protein
LTYRKRGPYSCGKYIGHALQFVRRFTRSADFLDFPALSAYVRCILAALCPLKLIGSL